MTSLAASHDTIADRHAAIQADALLTMLDMALHHPHKGIRLNAERRLSAYAASAHRAAEDVIKQREYERNFEAMAASWPVPEFQPIRRYGQPGVFCGE